MSLQEMIDERMRKSLGVKAYTHISQIKERRDRTIGSIRALQAANKSIRV